jgi:DNA-binding NarL/FixJ family response regulator
VTARVLVADDHAPTRAGIRAALDGHGFTVCAETADADAAVQLARRERPDVCLLDVRMPGGGISAARTISRELPDTAIVMLTVSRDDADLFDALRAGAAGYLLKDIPAARLPGALESVLAGEAALPGLLVARLVAEFRSRGSRRIVPLPRRQAAELTAREWDVLELMRAGLSTGEIAERLVVTPATVRSHVSAILRKLHVSDRRSALRLFER